MFKVPSEVKRASLELVVRRANGRVENHGTVSYYHKNVAVRAVVNVGIKLKHWFNNRRKSL